MAFYLLMSKLTTEGRKTLHRDPIRLVQVNKEVEAFGCKLVAQYALLGEYDFATIIEAPDAQTVAHLSVDLGSRGTISVTSMAAMPVEDFILQLQGPKQVGGKG